MYCYFMKCGFLLHVWICNARMAAFGLCGPGEFWEIGWANMTQVCFMADVGQEGEISQFFLPLRSHMDARFISVCRRWTIANVWLAEDFEAAKAKALKVGAVACYVEDIRREFVRIIPEILLCWGTCELWEMSTLQAMLAE